LPRCFQTMDSIAAELLLGMSSRSVSPASNTLSITPTKTTPINSLHLHSSSPTTIEKKISDQTKIKITNSETLPKLSISVHSKCKIVQPTTSQGSPWSHEKSREIRRSVLRTDHRITNTKTANTAFDALNGLASVVAIVPRARKRINAEALLRAASASAAETKLGKRVHCPTAPPTSLKKQKVKNTKKSKNRPVNQPPAPSILNKQLLNLIPQLRSRLSMLHNMFWNNLWPLLQSIGWTHCPASLVSAEVFVPPNGQNRYRSIFDTLCFLSSCIGTMTNNHQINHSIQYFVRNMLEQRKIIAMISQIGSSNQFISQAIQQKSSTKSFAFTDSSNDKIISSPNTCQIKSKKKKRKGGNRNIHSRRVSYSDLPPTVIPALSTKRQGFL